MKAIAGKAKAKHSNSSKRNAKMAARGEPKGMEIVNPHAGGIDCGAEEHYVAVPPQSVEPGQPAVRCFSAFTEGLDASVEWLKACGVTTVAIESTGVYWIALCQKLEAAGIEVFLVNARHVRHVPGRKTDIKDCQWLQRLHSFGLLSASFRPEDGICRLRSLQRHRLNLIWTAHLQQLAQRYESSSALAAKLPEPEVLNDAQAQNPQPAKPKVKRKPQANEPKIDLADYLRRICGVDLTQVIGLNVLSVLLIVSEIGVDMSKWRSAKAFCSWLGLCPRNKISGRKVLDTRTCKVINRVATTLRLAAQSVGRTNTALGIFYRRKTGHLGPAKATTATARKLACLVYHLLKYKEQYREPDPAAYQLKVQKTILAKIQRQAAALGYKLLPTALVPA